MSFEIQRTKTFPNQHIRVIDLIHKRNSLCYKALSTEWSRIGAINYYNNRHFIDKTTKADKQRVYYYVEQGYKKNWKKLDKAQLFFDGDTLYYYLY